VKLKQTEADKAVSDKTYANTGADLLEHIKLIEQGLEQVALARAVVADRYATLKAAGFDKKAAKALVRRRGMTREQIAAQGELALVVETYLAAIDAAEGFE
jgi:uncharacterized protein (UPF0335 family)